MARTERFVIPKLDPPETFYYGPEIDRHTARALGQTRFFTGVPCCKGHVAERWVTANTCCECVLLRHRLPEFRAIWQPRAKEWFHQNPERVKAYTAKRVRKDRAAQDAAT